jgi:hypothetical protein
MLLSPFKCRSVIYLFLYIPEKFEVFTAVKIHVVVFWVMTPCNFAVGYKP